MLPVVFVWGHEIRSRPPYTEVIGGMLEILRFFLNSQKCRSKRTGKVLQSFNAR